MKILLKSVLIFIIFNILISLPLFFFYSKSVAIDSLISISFFTAVWILVDNLISIVINLEVDVVSASFAIRIGLKFLLSMFFIGIMIWTKTFTSVPGILLFLVFYFIYTFLMLFLKEE